MAEHVTIGKIGAYVGQEITIKGWLYNRRDSGRLQFLLVRDGTGMLQSVAFKKEIAPEAWEAASQATQESSVIATGIVRADDRSPGGYELGLTAFEIVQLAGEYRTRLIADVVTGNVDVRAAAGPAVPLPAATPAAAAVPSRSPGTNGLGFVLPLLLWAVRLVAAIYINQNYGAAPQDAWSYIAGGAVVALV